MNNNCSIKKIPPAKNGEDIVTYIARIQQYSRDLWDEMGHDITKLSPQLQQELANYRRLLLASDNNYNSTTPTDAECESFWKCVRIGKECDGLPSPFVIDRLHDIYRMVSKIKIEELRPPESCSAICGNKATGELVVNETSLPLCQDCRELIDSDHRYEFVPFDYE